MNILHVSYKIALHPQKIPSIYPYDSHYFAFDGIYKTVFLSYHHDIPTIFPQCSHSIHQFGRNCRTHNLWSCSIFLSQSRDVLGLQENVDIRRANAANLRSAQVEGAMVGDPKMFELRCLGWLRTITRIISLDDDDQDAS